MARLSKELSVVSSPKTWKELWRPLEVSLDSIMEQTQANRYSKHFFGQAHLKTLVLFQLTEGHSLEDLHQAMTYDPRFKILTHCPSVSKSQLSRANSKRPVEAFRQVFHALAQQLPPRSKLPQGLKELLQRIRIFDGTFLALNPNRYPWAIYREQFRQPDAGVRMTLRLNLDPQAPDRVFIHPYRDNSANYFEECIDFTQKGFLYLFDREFQDHHILEAVDLSGNFFITRMKRTACYEVIKDHVTPIRFRQGLKIVKDQTVRIGKEEKSRIQVKLRRIEAVDPEGNAIVFLTNLFHLAASTLAQLYRLRWQIEGFFKWVKQHLKIKQFISYSLNGVLLQIYSALILYLLLALFKYFNKLEISFYDLLRGLKARMIMISPVIVVKWIPLKFPTQLSKNVWLGVTNNVLV